MDWRVCADADNNSLPASASCSDVCRRTAMDRCQFVGRVAPLINTFTLSTATPIDTFNIHKHRITAVWQRTALYMLDSRHLGPCPWVTVLATPPEVVTFLEAMDAIDVKKRFSTFFLFWSLFTFLTFFILSTFLFLKKRWQNRRESKRKNGNEIIQFNNTIHFSRVD